MDPESTEKPAPNRVARRALLTGAAASVAALGAQAILPAVATRAGGGTVILGANNQTNAPFGTEIERPGVSLAILAAPDLGLYGTTNHPQGAGVEGVASGAGGIGVRAAASGSNGVAVRAAIFGSSS